jgi:HK97 family phage major capsid protein
MTSVEVVSEPLTYERHGPHSYFQDMYRAQEDPRAFDRLSRHSAEMRVVGEKREARARQALDAGDLEYRVSPDTTQGTGGYLTVPLWLDQLFATAPRPGRILAALIEAAFDLPDGVSSINVPILTAGTAVQPVLDDSAAPSADVTDAAGSSTVVTLTGQSDWPIQALEQSPAGAALDWVIFTDMAAAYDAQLETQLLTGLGAAAKQLVGVLNVAGTVGVTYTNASPTGALLYPYLGQATARVGNNRNLPPEAFLMRTARWAWLATSEDTQGLPFFLPTFFLGDDEDTPDALGGVVGIPVFCDDALPANLGAGGNQDVIVALRPSDMVIFEGTPQTTVMREVLSGSLGVRFQMHNRVAAITNRYPSGISPITGTGLVVQSGFSS